MNHVIRILQIVFLGWRSCCYFRDGADPQHDPNGHLLASSRSLSHETRRGDELVHPDSLYHRGFIQGLLGSAVAIGAVTALHVWYPLHNEFQLSTMHSSDEHRRLDRGRRDWLRRFGNRDSPIPRRLVTVFVEVDARS